MTTVKGIFFFEKVSAIGTGATAKTVKQKIYCQAEEIELRYLNQSGEPMEIVERIPRAEFVKNFTFEPDYVTKIQDKKQQQTDKHIAIAEEHVRKQELYSAEYEYKNALKLDEENLRANFGIGKVYLEMGEQAKARVIFTKISEIDAIFEEKNKHFFNDCGI